MQITPAMLDEDAVADAEGTFGAFGDVDEIITTYLNALLESGKAKVGDLDAGWGAAEGPWAAFAGKSCFIIRLDSK